MFDRKSMLWTILFAALALTMAGCLPSGGGGGNNGGSGGGLDLNNGGGGNNGGGNNGGGDSCTTGDDCPTTYCNCTDGGVVNATRCDNGTCAPAADICPNACEQFGSEWDGTVSDIPDDEDAGSNDTGGFDDAGSELTCLDGQLEDNACNRCMDSFCCTQIENCFNTDACLGYGQCVESGGEPASCASEFPGGQSLWNSLISCQETNCPECTQ